MNRAMYKSASNFYLLPDFGQTLGPLHFYKIWSLYIWSFTLGLDEGKKLRWKIRRSRWEVMEYRVKDLGYISDLEEWYSYILSEIILGK